MRNKLLKTILLTTILLLSGGGVNAAVSKKLSLGQLEKAAEKGKDQVLKLKKEIYSMEQQLAKGSDRLEYLDKLLKKADKGVFILNRKLSTTQQEVLQRKEETRKLFRLTVVELLNGTIDEGRLATQKILLDRYRKRLGKLKKLDTRLKQQMAELDQMRAYYKQVKGDRDELLSVLNSMEMNKLSLVNRYVNTSKKVDVIKGRLSKLQTLKKVNHSNKKFSRLAKKLGMTFMPPVGKYSKLSNGKKGVSYNFKESGPLYAPQRGVIVYQGRLANYGKVIMIDHGNKIKSIILGDFLSKVKKGNKVKKGDLIGYSKNMNKAEGTIYFEVRKKNEVQNTIFLLDKKYLKDQNLKKL